MSIKLYKGMTKRQFKKHVGRSFEKLIHLSQFKIGDIYHDCDGFNHVICDHWVHKINTTGGWYIEDIQFLNKDGICSCGCGAFHTPLSVDEINQMWIVDEEDMEDLEAMGCLEGALRYSELAKKDELVDSRGVKLDNV